MSENIKIAPAQLWVGSHDNLVENVELFLRETFCKNGGCRTCSTCKGIRLKEHYAVLWLSPEKQYKVDDLEVIFETVKFGLDDNELFFIILEKSDFLTPACANRLLKPLEEPPPGYHFILLAERINRILPTIKSRCVIKHFAKEETEEHNHPVYKILTYNFAHSTPEDFLRAVDRTPPNDIESIELLDAITSFWINKYKKNVLSCTEAQQEEHIINCLKKASRKKPMPGSSKIFWRNVYLRMSL